MKLKVLGSSSKGNGYLFENEDSALIIECGLPIIEIKKVIDFKLSKIQGALCTHSHKDHSGFVQQYLDSGIKVFADLEGIKHHNLHSIQPVLQIGAWKIKCFEVVHDVKCYGFLLKHPESGVTLFLTDTMYSPVKFEGLNNIMVEANYDQKILDENILAGRIPAVVRNRIIQSHISLKTCKEMLMANDLSCVLNIVLLHLSDGNSDSKRFKQEIESLTGKRTYVADKNMIIDFNNKPF